MSAVSAFIADDEPVARAGLRHLLSQERWLQVVGEAGDGEATLRALQQLRPEVLFLDIKMPGMSGIEVLQRLMASGREVPLVVFTTAFAEHALGAFELGAIDYLLKPFGRERLHTTLGRLRAGLGEPSPPLMERWALAHAPGPLTRLFVRRGVHILPLAVTDISHLEAEDDYVRVHRVGGAATDLLRLTLSRLEERLDPQHFVRIHRGCVVNLAQVARWRRLPNGAMEAELKEGQRLPVSRARAQALRSLVA